jgi:Icc protein
MLIAQITDLHIGDGPRSVLNDARLDAVIERLAAAAPDVILATGDLIEDGASTAYERVAERLGALRTTVLPVLGNHDVREAFVSALGAPVNDGFVQYAVPVGDLRIIVLDTVEAGQHGGAFCARRLAWLQARLDEERATPTLIALHHPPVRSGIAWMDDNADGDWTRRLAAGLTGRDQVVGMIAGHLHRPMTTVFAGHPLVVAPAVAPAVVLDLDPGKISRPQERPRIVEEDPGFALHRWTGDRLVSHFGSAGEHRTLASFDVSLRPLSAS